VRPICFQLKRPVVLAANTALPSLLVQLRVFNTEHMNQAVFAFGRYEDASLRYTGIDSHEGLSYYRLFNTVVAIEK
jgi:hypothetical protein